MQEFLGWCDALGIRVVTIYLLSADNLMGRSEDELEQLFEIERRAKREPNFAKRYTDASLTRELFIEILQLLFEQTNTKIQLS